jgi:anhydro-N-acetylmuramic acid kinase
MTEASLRWAIGLMSGTSMDGIDAALIRSHGLSVVAAGPTIAQPYDEAFLGRLRAVLGGCGPVAEVERELTRRHARVVERLLAENGQPRGGTSVIGIHGHTILHTPEEGRTWQIADGALLAAETGIDVVADFRSRDIAEGGEGAPFAPLYHAALAAGRDRPLAVLNLGGVGKVTWIGRVAEQVLAFDSGPGNALIDDWARRDIGASPATGAAPWHAPGGSKRGPEGAHEPGLFRPVAAQVARARRL